jgi:cytochrome P450
MLLVAEGICSCIRTTLKWLVPALQHIVWVQMFQQHPSEHMHLRTLLPRTLSSRFVSQFALAADCSYSFLFARI